MVERIKVIPVHCGGLGLGEGAGASQPPATKTLSVTCLMADADTLESFRVSDPT